MTLPSRSIPIVLLTSLLIAGCSQDTPAEPASDQSASVDASPEAWLKDVAPEVGLDFVHFVGLTGQYYYVEIITPGCAFIDYDNDGDLDVYLVQGRVLEDGKSTEDAIIDPAHRPIVLGNRLYRNDLIRDGEPTGELVFTDVTEESGTGLVSYGMAATTADFNADGFTDLFVTNYGPDALLLNNGDGTFRDASAASGLDDPRWTTAATPIDFDLDGDLDLFVSTGGEFTVENAPKCERKPGVRDYCPPGSLNPVEDRLYRNDGTGVFTDASDLLTGAPRGHGLGAVVGDFDANGYPDIYVANDGDPNFLWLNDGERFTESALLNAAAYNDMGQAEAGMGIAIGDYDDDGDEDLFLTHLRGETNTLYNNDGTGFFTDATVRKNLSAASRPFTAFGVGFFDTDHDGDLDVFIANGDVRANDLEVEGPFPYEQPNQLMINTGNNRFEDASESAGPDLMRARVSRGAAFGDVDLDGDLDILVANANAPVELLLNTSPKQGHAAFVDVRLPSGAPALGAVVSATRSDGVVITRAVRADGSYFSSGEPAAHITWPEGTTITEFTVAMPGQMVRLTRTGLTPGERTRPVIGRNEP